MMNHEATILFATDFSDSAEQAYPYAVALTKALNGRLLLLNVLQVPMEMDLEYPVNELYLKQLGGESWIELQRIERMAQEDGLVTALRQMVGEAAHCIDEAAAEEAATLIVMGTHGRTGLSRLLMGSTAEKVVREAPCPVLTVRPTEGARSPDSRRRSDIDCVLVPLDFSDFSQAALEFATLLAKKLSARVRLIHALEATSYPLDFSLMHITDEKAHQSAVRARLEELASAVRADGIPTDIRCQVANPAELILAESKVAAGYLIVMGTHGRRGLSRLALGSVAESIVRQAPCPVLTVKSPKYQTGVVSKADYAVRTQPST
jgi:nucleotide-binding universal stress UspA family protein